MPVLHGGDVGQGVGLVGQVLAHDGVCALHGGYVASYAAVAHGGGVLQPCFDDDFGAYACGVAHAQGDGAWGCGGCHCGLGLGCGGHGVCLLDVGPSMGGWI